MQKRGMAPWSAPIGTNSSGANIVVLVNKVSVAFVSLVLLARSVKSAWCSSKFEYASKGSVVPS